MAYVRVVQGFINVLFFKFRFTTTGEQALSFEVFK